MNWPVVPIGDACLYAVDCPNRTAPVVDYETPYKMLRTTNVRGGFVDTRDLRCVTLETYERWTRRLKPQVGDVILTREAPLGDVGRLTSEEQVFLGQRLFHYRADPNKLDPRFLAYVLQSNQVQGWIKGVGFGATVQHAKVSDFLKIPIPLPPLATQGKVGDILSAYDDLIENSRRRIALLEDAARQLYREWFVRFRFPGHEHVTIIQGVPEGWERCAFRDVASVRKGKNITKERAIPGIIPVVAGGLTPAYFHNTANVIGSAVTISASGANAGFVNYYQTDIWASDCSYLGELENEHLGYLFLQLQHRQPELTSMQKGAAQPHVYPKDVERLETIRPPKNILLEFDDWIEPMFDQRRKLEKQLGYLAQARDLLLSKLMSGAVEV